MPAKLSATKYLSVDRSDEASIFSYAKELEGHMFQDVLDLGIRAAGKGRKYENPAFKGGMGTLIEECYFGYAANSDERPDFPDAGVELKATCLDVGKDGSARAGERLVITMIHYDRRIADELLQSHLWLKMRRILLIYYQRDKSVGRAEQKIRYVVLFTPPAGDMPIIEDDYRTIRKIVQAGRAQDLSERLTKYLGACTKGRTAATSYAAQWYGDHAPAKRRAFCFKQPYMNFVLHHYILHDKADAEHVVKDPSTLRHAGFEEYVLSLIAPYVGKTDQELCGALGIPFTGNKAQWTTIAYRMLGLHGERASEFEKAGINVRTVRIEEDGSVRESLSLDPFSFQELADEERFEDSELYEYFESTRFFFVAFDKTERGCVLRGALFWGMPEEDIEGPLQDVWRRAHDVVRRGVTFTERRGRDGRLTISNDLPKMSENPVAHVRPHSSKAAYVLKDGIRIGDYEHHADMLPDGQWMTKQSFWLNHDYIARIVRNIPKPAQSER